MRTPSDKRSDKEIIDEIINQAGDRSVEPLVKRRVDDLRKLSSPFTGNRRDNADYLEDLSKLIVRLKKQLKTVPWPLSAALSKPELFNRLYVSIHRHRDQSADAIDGASARAKPPDELPGISGLVARTM
jgi:hypothetical protein